MDEKIINNIKTLAAEMISHAQSGHTGIVLSAAPILYTLYTKHINIEASNPKWINRDRFIMSAGHGSALLYSILYFSGFDLTIEDLKKFRKIGSKTPGHPEVGVTPGVDMSTGPLGQGIASAVGMSLIGKLLSEKYVLPNMRRIEQGISLFDYKIYVLCGDGDLMEGISYEATSLAGNLNLDNLILLYDSNNISLDGDTSNTFTENVIDRFKAMGWYTDLVRNGNDINAIDNAISKAKTAGKPALIEIKTIIGKDTKYEGTNVIHGKPLTSEELNELKLKLNIPLQDFYVDEEAIKTFRKMMFERSQTNYSEWKENYKKYVDTYLNGVDNSLNYLFNFESEFNLLNLEIENNSKKSTRDLNANLMQKIAEILPNFIGGSADLSSSTRTYLKNYTDIKDGHYDGKNIWFGVREHAMGAILNGIALSNFRPFGSTFLTFSDYLKPAIRMSSLMNLPVIYIFSHDSITVGEDGPTHQPIEQLSTLRNIPNLNVFRPADIKELIGSWKVILNSTHNPSALILSKQEFEPLITTNSNLINKGAYIVRKENNYLSGIIIATGSEVYTALEIAKQLYDEKKIDIRVISMPVVELFLKQTKEYKQELLPLGYKTIVIEASSSTGWHQFVYNENYLITLNQFGASGTKDEVLEQFNFDYESIKKRVEALF
ncbi:MAG: transketolase [Bacilli bacterium]